MITNCGGDPFWNFSDTDAVFLQDAFSLLKIIIPAAIWLFTWRVCVTEKSYHRGNIQVLGLDETCPSNASDQIRSRYFLPLCIATSASTFALGLLAFQTYLFLQETLLKLFG